MLIEDVACPVEKLAEMTVDLGDMFQRYGYKEASCFGHALEGNLHLVFSQGFRTPEEVQRFGQLMDEMCYIVATKHSGSLKVRAVPGSFPCICHIRESYTSEYQQPSNQNVPPPIKRGYPSEIASQLTAPTASVLGAGRRGAAAFACGVHKRLLTVDAGRLQGEHGTGRNVAPYVEMEWGTRAYDIMWRLKELFDPEYVLNPGVVLNKVRAQHACNLSL